MCKNQIRNLLNILYGRSFQIPSLGSMTLDQDDVDISHSYLKNKSIWFEQKVVSEYEDMFARWNGSKYAFAFMSGRVALSAAIYALEIEPGEEVILPGYTCVVVPNAFHYVGVKTVYSDIELDTYGLDAEQLESKITIKTKAILLQHLYGLVCRDYEKLIDIAKHYKLKVIEDCSHATGAEYKESKVGNLGDIAFYSSEQSKVFNTIQGGVAVTNDDNIAKKLKEFYNQAPYPDSTLINKQLHNVILNYYQFKHVQRWWLGDLVNIRYGHKRIISTTREEEKGVRPSYYGQKMPAAIAALGINQLKKIDKYNEIRRQTAIFWDKWCDVNGYKKPIVVEHSTPVYLRYPILVEPEKKKNLRWAIKELGLIPGVWFISQIHPVDKTIDNCPNAEIAVKQCINFPTIKE